MNGNDRKELLIDYAERTLPKEQWKEVESIIDAHSASRSDADDLRAAFEALQQLPNEAVPDHYFSNFLPRLRSRIDRGDRYRVFSIPRFADSFLGPGLATAVVLAMVTLFVTFSPDSELSPLYQFIREAEPNEITFVISELPVVGTVPSEYVTVPSLDAEYFEIDAISIQSEKEMIASLDETELSMVLDRLQTNVTR